MKKGEREQEAGSRKEGRWNVAAAHHFEAENVSHRDQEVLTEQKLVSVFCRLYIKNTSHS